MAIQCRTSCDFRFWPPARWWSLDFNKGAAPPPPSASFSFLQLPSASSSSSFCQLVGTARIRVMWPGIQAHRELCSGCAGRAPKHRPEWMPERMLNKGNHPQMALIQVRWARGQLGPKWKWWPQFRLVNYYNLSRYMPYGHIYSQVYWKWCQRVSGWGLLEVK